MKGENLIIRLIQSHKEFEHFDYSKAVDWAIDLIRQGKETNNVLMLASFSKPIDRFEIGPYVSNVLKDFGLEELDHKSAVIATTHFHLNEILNDREIRMNLRSLYQLCVDNDHDSGLINFYLIYHSWDELEEIGVNYYFEGADLDNIEEVLKNEAKKWIDKNVLGKETEGIEQKRITEKTFPKLDKSNGEESDKTEFKTIKEHKPWWRRLGF